MCVSVLLYAVKLQQARHFNVCIVIARNQSMGYVLCTHYTPVYSMNISDAWWCDNIQHRDAHLNSLVFSETHRCRLYPVVVLLSLFGRFLLFMEKYLKTVLCYSCLKDRLLTKARAKIHIQNCLQAWDSHPSP